MPKLIRTLMSLRGVSQAQLSQISGVSPGSLSKYLSDSSDLRAESLQKVLNALGANVDSLLHREISHALGREDNSTLGEDLRFLLDRVDPISRKTLANTLIACFKTTKDQEVRSRIQRVKQYRDSIKTVRRQPC